MDTKPTTRGVLIGLIILVIVLAIALFYLVKIVTSKNGPTVLMPQNQSETLATPAAVAASDEIPVIEADLMTISQELMRIEAEVR